MDNQPVNPAATPANNPVQAPLPATVLVPACDCPPGSLVTAHGTQILIIAPAENGQVPILSPDTGLGVLPGSVMVLADRDRHQPPTLTATAMVLLYQQVRALSEAAASVETSPTVDELTWAQTLADLRFRIVTHYTAGRVESDLDTLNAFLREFGMAPVEEVEVAFTATGSYRTTGDPHSATDDANNLRIDLSDVQAVVPGSLSTTFRIEPPAAV